MQSTIVFILILVSPLPIFAATDFDSILTLACGPKSNKECEAKVCPNGPTKCPLAVALTNQAIFDFVKTYAQCDGCNTPIFEPGKGIDRCIEYAVTEKQNSWTVSLWVSRNCNFRYGNPSKSRITVREDKGTFKIRNIEPPEPYIVEPSYCRADPDCRCLSGSGVRFIGCSNMLYSPLSWAGEYECELCRCINNRCRKK